ncbi:hypothetical protein [Candidatus Pyrohabitans sp.]
MCDPAGGPSLHLLICARCGAENEVFSDEPGVSCESCGADIGNPWYHVHSADAESRGS